MLGFMANAQSNSAKYLYVSGQNGGNVEVYNCKTKKTNTVPGYFHNIGLDLKGNVYLLVCDQASGWGNYYVYKNFDTQNPYQSFVWNSQEGIYSSMAMKVKGDDVIVSGVQSLGFNNKGYSSRMFGYVNTIRVFRTDYDRKSLKYENFRGYMKVSGKNLVGYGEENNSGNPQGDHLSCVYHINDVDYDGQFIYACGWGEREYSKVPLGSTTKYYLVRRCPRVWRNGADYIKNLFVHNMDDPQDDKTGAFWTINYLGPYNVYTSGHLGSVPTAWILTSPLKVEYPANSVRPAGYPGFYREESFELDESKWVTFQKQPATTRCHIFLAKGTDGLNRMYGIFTRGSMVVNSFCDLAEDVAVVNNEFFYSVKKTNSGVTVEWHKNIVRQKTEDFYALQFTEHGQECTLPAAFRNYTNLRIVARK